MTQSIYELWKNVCNTPQVVVGRLSVNWFQSDDLPSRTLHALARVYFDYNKTGSHFLHLLFVFFTTDIGINFNGNGRVIPNLINTQLLVHF